MTTAYDSALASAAGLRLDEVAALALLEQAHPDWPDCTGDDDRCLCSFHEFRRIHNLEAFAALCRQDEVEWLRRVISITSLVVQKLVAASAPRETIAHQEQWLADLKRELKEKLHAKRGKNIAG